MRRARRGRPFSVRVRAVGDTLTGVRLIVRDRLNRRVGSSGRSRLKGKTRKPRVRVTRRLRKGRYRISRHGRDTPRASASAAPARIRIRRR